MINDYYLYSCEADRYAEKIERQYGKHGVYIEITSTKIMDDRIIFKLKLKRATRASRVFDLAEDVQLRLKLPLFRPYKVGYALYIAISKHGLEYGHLPEILDGQAYSDAIKKMKLPHVVGYDDMGRLVIVDMADNKHLLIGGSSGSGKTVALKCLILSIIGRKSPNAVNLILIDVGANDLMPFAHIPHLSYPIIRDRDTALRALLVLQKEMMRRKELEINNNDEFRALPRLVCVIDEYPELISGLSDKKTTKLLTDTVSSLLRLGRHSNIHLVLAAQNPTLQNMKCDLGNITARMAFTCAKSNYSMTILNEGGAETLSGNGDMYFKSPGFDGKQHLQGLFITEGELKQEIMKVMLSNLRSSVGEYRFKVKEDDLLAVGTPEEVSSTNPQIATKSSADDRLLAEIIVWSLGRESISCNMICTTFHIGWNRANSFLKKLHSMGISDDMYEKLPRAVLPDCKEDLSEQAEDLLSRYGYTAESIEQAFGDRAQDTRVTN